MGCRNSKNTDFFNEMKTEHQGGLSLSLNYCIFEVQSKSDYGSAHQFMLGAALTGSAFQLPPRIEKLSCAALIHPASELSLASVGRCSFSNPRLCSGPFICGAVCGCYNAFINMDSPNQNYICITSNDSSSFKVPVELKICLLIFVFLPFCLCCLFKILFLPPL
jgi:hypothetical protein